MPFWIYFSVIPENILKKQARDEKLRKAKEEARKANSALTK